MFDKELLEEARETMGTRFSQVIGYYLEDVQMMLSDIDTGIIKHDMKLVSDKAHTIKSSSRQFGIMDISEAAAKLEEVARSIDLQGGIFSDLRHLRDALRNKFEASRGELEKLRDAA